MLAVTLLLGVNACTYQTKTLARAENIRHIGMVDFCRVPGETVACVDGKKPRVREGCRVADVSVCLQLVGGLCITGGESGNSERGTTVSSIRGVSCTTPTVQSLMAPVQEWAKGGVDPDRRAQD